MSEVVTKLIVDCSTGETREEILTAEELAQREADTAAYAVEQAAREAAEAEKAAAKASAITKLSKLGLSDAEIAALVGA